MYRLIRPLTSTATLLGGAHALIGAVLATPAVLIATAALLLPGSKVWRLLLFGAVMVGVLLVAAGPAVTRRLAVELANRMLRVGVPTPDSSTRPGWGSRCRTGGWLIAHAATGYGLLFMVPVLLIVAAMLPGMWLSGGGPFTYLWWELRVSAGTAGAWTLAAALVHLAL
ncbi:MAG: hypothetical protein ACRD0P_40095, partial [Stackebrandtia sp.]